METIQKIKDSIKANIELAEEQLKLMEGVAMSENTVCVWPDTLLHVGSDNGKAVISSQVVAAQYKPEVATEICATVKNGRGEHPMPMKINDYYRRYIHMQKELINTLV